MLYTCMDIIVHEGMVVCAMSVYVQGYVMHESIIMYSV